MFNVKLDSRELGAVMSHFDKDGSGEVDCAEFLLEFFKLGTGLGVKHRSLMDTEMVETQENGVTQILKPCIRVE